MTEAPQVSVHCKDLGGKAPVAVTDSIELFDLAIDFSRPPEEIAAGLTMIFQEAVDTGRWIRRGTHRYPARTAPEDHHPPALCGRQTSATQPHS